MNSLTNGALKYDHVHPTIPIDLFLKIKNALIEHSGALFMCPQFSKGKAIRELDPTKACGFPFCYIYGPTKGDVLNALRGQGMSDEEIFDYFFALFEEYTQISCSTLKDELRIEGKDARFFIPANIVMVAVGNWLFGAQNQQMQRYHNFSPIKIGLQTPGPEGTRLWGKICTMLGGKHDTDGSENDAKFNICIAYLFFLVRASYLKPELYEVAYRWYCMTYTGCVEVGGFLYFLWGQQSGQTNTSSDTSLLSLCGLLGTAILKGWTVTDFKEKVYAVINGDDMLWVEKTNEFSVLEVNHFWNDIYGMYLECSQLEGKTNEDLSFCGMHPMIRDVEGEKYLIYSYKEDKMLDSANHVTRGLTKYDRVSKLIALTMNVFGNKEEFEFLRNLTFSYVDQHSMHMHPALFLLSESYLLKHYMGFESCREPPLF